MAFTAPTSKCSVCGSIHTAASCPGCARRMNEIVERHKPKDAPAPTYGQCIQDGDIMVVGKGAGLDKANWSWEVYQREAGSENSYRRIA